jgi:hypothetical protein
MAGKSIKIGRDAKNRQFVPVKESGTWDYQSNFSREC